MSRKYLFKGDGLRASFALGLLIIENEKGEVFFTVRFPFDISPRLFNVFTSDLIEGLEESYWGRTSKEHDYYKDYFYKYFGAKPSLKEQNEMLEMYDIDILKDYNERMSKCLKMHSN